MKSAILAHSDPKSRSFVRCRRSAVRPAPHGVAHRRAPTRVSPGCANRPRPVRPAIANRVPRSRAQTAARRTAADPKSAHRPPLPSHSARQTAHASNAPGGDSAPSARRPLSHRANFLPLAGQFRRSCSMGRSQGEIFPRFRGRIPRLWSNFPSLAAWFRRPCSPGRAFWAGRPRSWPWWAGRSRAFRPNEWGTRCSFPPSRSLRIVCFRHPVRMVAATTRRQPKTAIALPPPAVHFWAFRPSHSPFGGGGL